jgi:hypothetical protein
MPDLKLRAPDAAILGAIHNVETGNDTSKLI